MMNLEGGSAGRCWKFSRKRHPSEHMPSGIDTMGRSLIHQSEFEEKEQKKFWPGYLTGQSARILSSGVSIWPSSAVGRGTCSTMARADVFSLPCPTHVGDVNVKMIDQGSSELNIIIGVKNEDFEPAIQAIYNIFVMTRL